MHPKKVVLFITLLLQFTQISAGEIFFTGNSKMSLIYAPDNRNEGFEASYNLKLKANFKNISMGLSAPGVTKREDFFDSGRQQYAIAIRNYNASVKTALFKGGTPFTVTFGRPYSYLLNPYLYYLSGSGTTQMVRVDDLKIGSATTRGFISWKDTMANPVYGTELSFRTANGIFIKTSLAGLNRKGHWTAPSSDFEERNYLMEISGKITSNVSLQGVLGSHKTMNFVEATAAQGAVKKIDLKLDDFLGFRVDIGYRDFAPSFAPSNRYTRAKTYDGNYFWLTNSTFRWNPIDENYGQIGTRLSVSKNIPDFGILTHFLDKYVERDMYRDRSYISSSIKVSGLEIRRTIGGNRVSLNHNRKYAVTGLDGHQGQRNVATETLFVLDRRFYLGPSISNLNVRLYSGDGICKTIKGSNMVFGDEKIFDVNIKSAFSFGKLQGFNVLGGIAIYRGLYGSEEERFLYKYLGIERQLSGGLNLIVRLSRPNIDEREYSNVRLPWIGFYEPVRPPEEGDSRIFDNCVALTYQLNF